MPKTSYGRWAVGVAAVSLLSFAAAFMVPQGIRWAPVAPGAMLWGEAMLIFTCATGVIALLLAALARFRAKDTSLAVVLALVVGVGALLLGVFAVAEGVQMQMRG